MKIVGIAVLFIFVSVLFYANRTIGDSSITAFVPTATPEKLPCKAAFADGGGPYYQPNAPMRENITPPNVAGDKLTVEGKIVRSDCVTAAGGVILDIWQADGSGEYQDNWYRGKVTSKPDGSYRFETVIPLGYGEGTAYRPPHIHFKVWEGEKELVTSQMFFPDVKGREGFDDAYIITMTDRGEDFYGSHDIILP